MYSYQTIHKLYTTTIHNIKIFFQMLKELINNKSNKYMVCNVQYVQLKYVFLWKVKMKKIFLKSDFPFSQRMPNVGLNYTLYTNGYRYTKIILFNEKETLEGCKNNTQRNIGVWVNSWLHLNDHVQNFNCREMILVLFSFTYFIWQGRMVSKFGSLYRRW